jgi:putative endonuclease
MSDRRLLGARAEAAAARALEARGYRAIGRNVRSRDGELDLVCLDGGTFVFCEIKARRPSTFPVEEAVSAAKRRRLARLAAGYLLRIGRPSSVWRIELVAVRLNQAGDVLAVEVIPID